MVTENELIDIVTAVKEIADEQNKWNSHDIAQRASIDRQRTEIALDELDHMGFVEKQDGRWRLLV